MTTASSPNNRLGLDYRHFPPHKILPSAGIVDVHNHTREPLHTQNFVDAASAWGISEFYTMCPLEHAPAIQQSFPNRFRFIAIPNWQASQNQPLTDDFFKDWTRRVDAFAQPPLNARLIKFHAAPGTCKRWAITLSDPRIRQLAQHAYDLGYHFMSHVGDPKAWFFGNGKYADGSFGTFDSQFAQLESLLEKYPDRLHLGAHFGGSLESLDALAKRLDKYPHYVLDSSATKWIVRAIAEQSTQSVRDFILHYQDRILFGSDLVVGEKYDFDHYASRYWAHQMLWETDYSNQSNIDDPDAGHGFNPLTNSFDPARADGTPHITGLNLPPETLQKLYRDNALRLLPR